MAKIISVVNQKGGVGKTTTTVNLSACLEQQGKKVLLIDLDPQGNATSGLGIDTEELESTVYQVLIGEITMEESVVQTEFGELYLSPSDIQLAGAEIELVSMEKREFMLKNALKDAQNQYDYILIDCPPSLNLMTVNALVASDSVLIPVQCEYYALEGLSRLMQTVKSIKKQLNETLEIEGILLTMYDSRTNLSMMVAEEVKQFFPKKVYQTVIPRNVRLSEAPSYGQPIIAYDPYSRGSESYTALAEEVINNNK
ncbi:MAG: ParA family protein [Ruminococcaceae bacterium]|nr:ParA family protein [Oscillospiraceae bacterium]